MSNYTTPATSLSKSFNIKDFKFEQKTIIRAKTCYSSKVYDISPLIDEKFNSYMKRIMEELIKEHNDYRIYCVERNITITPNTEGNFNRFEFSINFDDEKKIIWQKPRFWFEEAYRAFDSPIIGGCDMTLFASTVSKEFSNWENKVE